MDLPAPFGKYHLLEKLAVGGMAEVYLAKSFGAAGFERLLVIKKILPHMAEDNEFITMFIDEARIASTLNHSNIVQINELGKEDNDYFIAMEFVHGKDLSKIYEILQGAKKKMPISLAVLVTSRLCEGLDYAHRKADSMGRSLNIIHRDVSPGNILVSYDGDVKIIDFGIAKAQNRMGRTTAGTLKGKFGYMSPEQVRGLPLDHRSDIFSLGILLYEMLTGERLFGTESDFGTLEKVRNAIVTPPTTYNRKIPGDLEKIVMCALARDPEERYDWASDLQEDLARFLMEDGSLITTKSLAAFMRDTFARKIAEENERLTIYRRRGYPWVDAAHRDSGDDGMHEEIEEDALSEPKPEPVPHEPAAAESSAPQASSTVILSSDDESSMPAPVPDQAESSVEVDSEELATVIMPDAFSEDGPLAESSPGRGAQAAPEPEPEPAPIARIKNERRPQRPKVRKRPGGAVRRAAAAETRLGQKAPRGKKPRRGRTGTEPLRRPPAPLPPKKKGPLGAIMAFAAGLAVAGLASYFIIFTPWQSTPADSAALTGPQAMRPPEEPGDTRNDPGAGQQTPPADEALAVDLSGSDTAPSAGENVDAADQMPAEEKPPVQEPPAEKQPAEEKPPAEEQPPAEQPPAEKPPAEKPPAEKPPAEKPPSADKDDDAAKVEDKKPATEDKPAESPKRTRLKKKKKRTGKKKRKRRRRKEVKVAHATAGASLVIKSSPPGATILLNGKKSGTTPRKISGLDPGKNYFVVLKKAGYKPHFEGVKFAGKKKFKVDAKMKSKGGGGAAKATKGYLIANTKPWARVIIDGRDTGLWTPIPAAKKLALPAGKHKVTFKTQDGQTLTVRVEIQPGKTAKIIKKIP